MASNYLPGLSSQRLSHSWAAVVAASGNVRKSLEAANQSCCPDLLQWTFNYCRAVDVAYELHRQLRVPLVHLRLSPQAEELLSVF
jgi:hypothetical protein